MELIHFHDEDTAFKLQKPTLIRHWIRQIISLENYHLTALNYIFCSDSYLHQLNLSYLHHDNFTDVVTFDYKEEHANNIEADIFISVDRVKENARNFEVKFYAELTRVMIHGLLHLMGYNDKNPKEQKVMRKKEEACLSLLEQIKS